MGTSHSAQMGNAEWLYASLLGLLSWPARAGYHAASWAFLKAQCIQHRILVRPTQAHRGPRMWQRWCQSGRSSPLHLGTTQLCHG